MKHLAIILSILTTICCTSCAYALPQVPVEIEVVDQDGNAVENVDIKLMFINLGMDSNSITGKTNADGIFSATGYGNSRIRIYATKDKYYDSQSIDKSIYDPSQPNDPKVIDQKLKIVLNEIINPVRMYARSGLTLSVPAYDTPVGYDFEECDWVAPYGAGKVSDAEFTLSGFFNDFNDKDVVLTMNFPNPHDGLVVIDSKSESKFKSPYKAPLNGYNDEKQWKLYRKRPESAKTESESLSQADESWDEQNNIYIFRIRTLIDKAGNVEEAYYGKIQNGIIYEGNVGDGRYTTLAIRDSYLNPTINDRNLEYAVGQSLVKDVNDPKQP